MIALADAVEALSSGSARLLAAELRELLESACAPGAEVIAFSDATKKRT